MNNWPAVFQMHLQTEILALLYRSALPPTTAETIAAIDPPMGQVTSQLSRSLGAITFRKALLKVISHTLLRC